MCVPLPTMQYTDAEVNAPPGPAVSLSILRGLFQAFVVFICFSGNINDHLMNKVTKLHKNCTYT